MFWPDRFILSGFLVAQISAIPQLNEALILKMSYDFYHHLETQTPYKHHHPYSYQSITYPGNNYILYTSTSVGV